MVPSGGSKYSREDVWGHKGGSYTIFVCEDCKTARVRHRRGWDDLPYENQEEAAAVVVFGRNYP
ncbi:hypothetical protein ACFL9U_01445 [Thermodesulfobacteriota bacterium]